MSRQEKSVNLGSDLLAILDESRQVHRAKERLRVEELELRKK
jgi:hypothetical protein